MKISARNLFTGKVTAIKKGAVNAEVELGLAGSDLITAGITNGSVERLGLTVGAEVTALIKAPLILVATGVDGMKFSTRNMLKGTVEQVEHGAVNCEVDLRLPGGNLLTAIITERSAKDLTLRAGDTAWALFKASSVILAVRA
ncbi:MAG TPA: TOBE domain-containing protein [Geobacteraceae bacterium]